MKGRRGFDRPVVYLALAFGVTLLLAQPLQWLLGSLIYTAHPASFPPKSGFGEFVFHPLMFLHPFSLAPAVWALVQEGFLVRATSSGRPKAKAWLAFLMAGFVAVLALIGPIMVVVALWNRPGYMNAAQGVQVALFAIPSLICSYALRAKMVGLGSRVTRWVVYLIALAASLALGCLWSFLSGDGDGGMQMIVAMVISFGLVTLAGGGLAHLIAGQGVFRPALRGEREIR